MVDQPTSTAEKAPTNSTNVELGTLLKVIAAAIAVGGVLLHLIGATANQVYWDLWGLDSEMFPKASDLTVILGYQAVWYRGLKALAIFLRDYWVPFVLVGVVLAGLLIGMLWLANSRYRDPLAALLARQSAVREGIEVTGVSLAIFGVAIPAAFVSVVLVLVLPVALGEAHGRELVAGLLQDFSRGCDSPFVLSKCATLTRGTDPIGRGFLIGASTSHIAIFDPQAQRTVLFERQGLKLVGAPKLTAYPLGMLPKAK